MKKSSFAYSLLLFSISGNLMAITNDLPASLRESISVAVKYNPKTVSTNELLESIHYQTLASKADVYYPGGSIRCGSNGSNSQTKYSSMNSTYKGSSASCDLSVSMTVYDGGAALNRYKSQEASEAATKAAYNTSDSMIPNTRGGLANKAMSNYVSLINTQGNLNYSNKVLGLLKKISKVEDDILIQTAIEEWELEISQTVDSQKIQKESFEYTVTLPPADTLEDLDETIKSLKIPASADDAILLALNNGPEVIRRNLNVKMAEFDLKATKGSIGPYISVSANVGSDLSRDRLDPSNNYRGSSASVGISVTIPLDVSGKYRVKSSEARLASKISEKEAAIKDAKHSISEQYKRLVNLRKNYEAESKSYSDMLLYVESVANSAEQNNFLGRDISKFLASVASLDKRYYQLQRTKNEMLYNLFSIQQVTGQLFSDFIVE